MSPKELAERAQSLLHDFVMLERTLTPEEHTVSIALTRYVVGFSRTFNREDDYVDVP